MRQNRTTIYIASFIFAIPVALTSYINSSFLENFLTRDNVGLVYILASLLTIVAMVKLPAFFTRLGNRHAAGVLSLLTLFSFVFLAFAESVVPVVGAFILNFVSITLLYASIDIFVEDFSKSGSVGQWRGFYLATTNLAWILTQFVSSKIIIESSFAGLYMISAFLMLVVYLFLKWRLRNFKDPRYQSTSFVKGIKFFTKNKNLGRIYLINLILKFFYAWMVLYIPIYLHEYLYFNWSDVSVIFTIMLLPFLLEMPLGKLSDKIGERKILKLGFLVSAAATLCMPLITTSTVAVWAGILFMTRVGAAMIEVMSENYFFKSVKEENVEALGFFRNTSPVSYILGPMLAVPILLVLPSFVYLFYILGVILLLGFLLTSKLKEVR